MVDTRAGEVAPVPEEGAAIQVRDLVVSYGRKRAVDGLSMTVPRGSALGGAG